MNFPTLYVGQSDPDRDAEIAAKVEQAKADGKTRRAIAEEIGIRVEELRDACARHASRREFDLFITDGNTRTRVCHVVTTKPFTDVSIAAFKAYKATLQKLSLPGWRLAGDEHTVSVVDLQRALMSGKVIAPKAKAESRQRLGLKVAA